MDERVNKAQKFEYLEGLRGIAALAVLVGHTLGAFWPSRSSLETDPFSFLGLMHVFYDGGYAVLIFFVLSGYVLTFRAGWPGGKKILVSTIMKRYPRLMIPALGSILMAYLLLYLDLMRSNEVSKIIGSVWLGYFYNFPADLVESLMQGSMGAMLFSEVSYNSSLWTISIEFYGALIIVIMALAFRGLSQSRYLIFAGVGVLAVCFLGTYGVYYAALIAGLMLTLKQERVCWPPLINAVLIFSALWLGGVNNGLMYSAITSFDLVVNGNKIEMVVLSKAIAAVLLVLVTLHSKALQRLFSISGVRYLGRISFSVYLIHVPIICSFGCWIFLGLQEQHLSLRISALLASVFSILFSLIMAHFYERYIDRFAITIAGEISNLFFSMIGSIGFPALKSSR